MIEKRTFLRRRCTDGALDLTGASGALPTPVSGPTFENRLSGCPYERSLLANLLTASAVL